MPWYSDCPRCREALDAAIAHDDDASRTLSLANDAAPQPAPDSGRPSTFLLSRSGRQTLHHYLPRVVAATLSATVFCLTGVFSMLGATAGATAQPVDRVGGMNAPAAGTDRGANLTAARPGAATSAGYLQLSPTARTGDLR